MGRSWRTIKTNQITPTYLKVPFKEISCLLTHANLSWMRTKIQKIITLFIHVCSTTVVVNIQNNIECG